MPKATDLQRNFLQEDMTEELKEGGSVQNYIIGCWSPACYYISFSNFPPFPISTIVLGPSVHVHPTISTQICKGNPSYLVSKTETQAQTVGRWFVVASLVEKGLVVALTPAEFISNPPHGCFSVAYRIHTSKCSSPTCFG